MITIDNWEILSYLVFLFYHKKSLIWFRIYVNLVSFSNFSIDNMLFPIFLIFFCYCWGIQDILFSVLNSYTYIFWILFAKIELGWEKYCQKIKCLLCLHRRCFDFILIRDKIPCVVLRCGPQIPYFEETNQQLQKWFAIVTWLGWSAKRILKSCREIKNILVIFTLVECYLDLRSRSPVSKEGNPVIYSLTKILKYPLEPRALSQSRTWGECFFVQVIYCGKWSQETGVWGLRTARQEEGKPPQIEGFLDWSPLWDPPRTTWGNVHVECIPWSSVQGHKKGISTINCWSIPLLRVAHGC